MSPVLLTAIYSLLLLASAFWGKRAPQRQAESHDSFSKFIFRLIPVSLITVVSLFIHKIYAVIFDEHSWIRFEKTWVIALGFPLYFGETSGPAMATIYGPVSTLFYLPATWVSDPFVSLQIAQLLAILIFYLPVLWIHLDKVQGEQKDNGFAFSCFLLFCLSSLLLTSVKNGVFIVHADAPTLGLGALACYFVIYRGKEHNFLFLFLSSLFAVLAVWSKQVAVPLLPALALYILLVSGLRTFLRYVLFLSLSGILVSAVFLITFDAKNMIFNMFTIPGHHPFKDGGFSTLFKTFTRIVREWPILLLWGGFSIIPLVATKSKPRSFRPWIQTSPWFLFIIVGTLMMPLAILSNIKVGGSNNTLSHANYYFLIASTLAFKTGQRDLFFRDARWIAWIGKTGLIFATVLLLSIQIPTVYYRIWTTGKKANFAKEAYEFIKRHPDESYFPRLTLLHLLGEGKLYHTADGLMDRHWAGMPVSTEHFKAHSPDQGKLKWIAFHHEDHKWLLPVEGFSTAYSNTEELPHFTVYKNSAH